MSDYKQHIGKIKSVEKKANETFYDYTKRAFGENFKQEAYDYFIEFKHYPDFTDDCGLYDKAFLEKDVWYMVIEDKKIDSYDDIQELLPQPDGSYIYIMGFHNDSTCLSEMLEESLENL